MSKALVYENGLGQVLDSARFEQEPEWLVELRSKGAIAHHRLGVPTTRSEEWKYTPLRAVAETAWALGEPGPAVFDVEPSTYAETTVRVYIVNGRFDRNLSNVATSPGMTVMSLRDAIYERPEVATLLGSKATIDDHSFASLNTAVFVDGVYVHLARGCAVEPVIELVYVTSGEGMVIAPRTLIVAEESATAKIVEQYVSNGSSRNLTVPVTEVILAKHANVEHVRVQDESENSFHIGLWETAQIGESEYRSYNVAFGGALGRLDQNIFLDGEHITSRLDGVVVARGSQLIDNHTKLDHAKPNCNSFEIYKQIIDDKATVVFNGKIFVHQDAQKTDAKQTNQALLLSGEATINSKPQLEIFADDVKCTHGATVGQIEETFRFYMRSRGIPKATADAILVYAFAAEVLELISDDVVRERLERRLYSKLGIDLGE
jgi:Fe-S cluster assembly protein SufD